MTKTPDDIVIKTEVPPIPPIPKMIQITIYLSDGSGHRQTLTKEVAGIHEVHDGMVINLDYVKGYITVEVEVVP